MIKVGLDIGNSKISCVVSEKKNNIIKILSFISLPTNNIKKSFIADIDKVKSEINEVLIRSAKDSQTEILSINLNVPAVDSISLYSSSNIKLSNEKISELHIKKAINQSDFLDVVENYKIIHK